MVSDKSTLVPLKKIVLVVDQEDMGEIQEILKSIDVRGYTYIKGAGGYGSRGERNPDTFGLKEENIFIMLACTEDQTGKLVNLLGPRLPELGGMCLISDCEWVKGPAISY